MLAISCHRLEQATGCAGVRVPGAPDQQLPKDRRQIDSFLRQPVAHASSIRRILLRGDDVSRFELAQAVRQDVRRDSLTGLLKFLERPETTNHQIANDQKRPAVADDLQRNADRALRTALRFRSPGHEREPTRLTCNLQVICTPRLGPVSSQSPDAWHHQPERPVTARDRGTGPAAWAGLLY